MLTDITLGQYYPGSSVIHGLDPRAKILATLLFIAAIFFAESMLPTEFWHCLLQRLFCFRACRY